MFSLRKYCIFSVSLDSSKLSSEKYNALFVSLASSMFSFKDKDKDNCVCVVQQSSVEPEAPPMKSATGPLRSAGPLSEVQCQSGVDSIGFREMFLGYLVVRYRGKNSKGVLDRPWTKWKVLKAISSTLKSQFTVNPES